MVNEAGQVLVIKEKYHEVPKWKFPGGLADRGKSLTPPGGQRESLGLFTLDGSCARCVPGQ